MNDFQIGKAFLASKLRRVTEFLIAQGITLAGNSVYGLLCVRLLSIPEYAKFVVVFGFLGTLVVLMDIGFSTALLPLIGEKIDDLRLIANYVASLRQLAYWLFYVLAPASAIIYPLIVRRQHWSAHVILAMVVILLVTAWCARVAGAYGAVLIVRRDRKMWYRVQMIQSLGTLALLGIVWAVHALNGFSAILINVAGIVYTAVAYYFRARHLLGISGTALPQNRAAIVHFTAPNLPGTIFYAFQGQIALLLITYFGHSTAVASVGALARLGQFFALFSQMSLLLIEPYFAKLPRERLKRNYVALLVVAALVLGTVTALSRIFPGAFLWILGPKYSSLRYEVFLIIASSSLSLASGMLWTVHNARRFVYWWGGISFIVATLVIQIVCVWKTDLSTIRGVLMMNLWVALASLVLVVLAGIYGFLYGPRESVKLVAVAAEARS